MGERKETKALAFVSFCLFLAFTQPLSMRITTVLYTNSRTRNNGSADTRIYFIDYVHHYKKR